MPPRTIIGPQPCAACKSSGARCGHSPQYKFLTTQADFALFNGQPGSGKTGALTLDLLRGVGLPLFRGVAFRRQANQLTQAGGLWDQGQRWFPHAGGRLVASPHLEARFPSGALIQYAHLNQEKDKEAHDGASYDAIAFDELPHFTVSQFWYLAGSRNRGVSGYRPTVRACTMAAPDSWVHKLLRPWLDAEGGWPDWDKSGQIMWIVRNPFDDEVMHFTDRATAEGYVLMLRAEAHPDDPIHHLKPKSMTVVHARTTDNQILLESSKDYAGGLAMLTKYERERLAGNWNARPPSAGMFDRRFFKVLETAPRDEDILYSVRGWDRASKVVSETNLDPDWTRGVRLDWLRNGLLVISNVVSLRGRPGEVDRLMATTAMFDGPHVTQAMWINPGDSGEFEQEKLSEFLRKHAGVGPLIFKRQIQNKEAYARPCASFFDPEIVGAQRGAIVRGPWNGECFAEAEMFPLKKHPVTGDELHDDFVDALMRAFIEVSERQSGRSGRLLDWASANI